MIFPRGCRIAALGLAAGLVAAGFTLPQSTALATTSASAAFPKPTKAQKAAGVDDSLSEQTGLSVSIDDIAPASIIPGRPIVLSGIVTNEAEAAWDDNQVYFTITNTPVTTKAGLDDYAQTGDEAFGDTLFDIGSFDEIGSVAPGASEPYRLSIPWSKVQSLIGSAPAGVYHVGVSVLGQQEGEIRDRNADARADTVMSYLPDSAASRPVRLVQAIPVTAAVSRQTNGLFIDDELAALISDGGRLRNVLDFVLDSPAGTLDVVIDPAVLDAIEAMAAGYRVQSLKELANKQEPVPGVGRFAAQQWLDDLRMVRAQQKLYLLPWGNPDASALAAQDLPGIMTSAVRVSSDFALAEQYSGTIADWPIFGQTTRAGLSTAAIAGTTLHVLSQASLPNLTPEDDNGYPPAVVSVNTSRGQLRAVVTRSDIGGIEFPRDLDALDYRQYVMAETTVRALSSTEQPVVVVAAPQNWDPGSTADLDLAPITSPADVLPQSLEATSDGLPQGYVGPVTIADERPGLSSGVVAAIRDLRENGRIYVDLLTSALEAEQAYQRELAMSGSSTWEYRPVRGQALIRRAGRDYSAKVAAVTLTVPTFVALSSASGRFPITVTNGLEEPVRVNVNLIPINPALQLEPDAEQPLSLGPGESLDIEVSSKASGSGLTSVRGRLATASNRVFGEPQQFEVRATKIGLAIWVVMGVLGLLLFSGAAWRIVKRFRSGGFHPRGETNL